MAQGVPPPAQVACGDHGVPLRAEEEGTTDISKILFVFNLNLVDVWVELYLKKEFLYV